MEGVSIREWGGGELAGDFSNVGRNNGLSSVTGHLCEQKRYLSVNVFTIADAEAQKSHSKQHQRRRLWNRYRPRVEQCEMRPLILARN